MPTDLTTELHQARQRRARLQHELDHLSAPTTDGLRERAENLQVAITRCDGQISELQREQQQHDLLRQLAQNPNNLEAGVAYPHERREYENSEQLTPAFTQAMHGLEAIHARGVLPDDAGRRLEALLRGPDADLGLDAGYLAAVADPSYERAFGKLLRYGQMAPMRMSQEEQQAVQAVTRAEEMRDMSVGSDSAGGFGVPAVIDPSIILTGAGAVTPLRQLASTATISTAVWKGVSSAGVTAGFHGEATEATDNSPVLAQPIVYVEKAHAFIPFSIEVGMDYAGLQQELAVALADGKATLEATKFLLGAGTSVERARRIGPRLDRRVDHDLLGEGLVCARGRVRDAGGPVAALAAERVVAVLACCPQRDRALGRLRRS